MSDIKKDTLKGVKWTAFERISMQGIQFLIGVVLARLLDPSDFGIIGMMTIFITLSNTFVDGGFSNALIRKIDCDEKDYSTAFYFNIVIGIVCYVVLYLCSPIIASFFNTPILSHLLKVLALTLFINSLSVVHIAKLSREINFKVQAQATFIGVLLSGLFGITLAYMGYGVWSLVFQQLANSVIKVLVIWIKAHWRPMIFFSKESFKTLFGYGSKILISNLIGTLYNQLSTILIGKYYTTSDLGYYSRGQQFAHLPTVAITDVLGKVTFPILSRYQNDDQKLVPVYRKYISVTSLVIFFCMTLLASLAKPFVLVLLSEKWMSSVIFLQIFCFTYMFEHISKLNLNLLQVKGRSDLYLRLEIIKKIIGFSLMVCAIPFGVITICLSALIYSQVSLAINTYYTGKLFGLGYFKQMNDFIKYFLLSIVACAPGFLLTFLNFDIIFQILSGIILAVAIYYIALRKDNNFIELMGIIKNKF